ncbi:MAG: DoxX family protein [Methylophilaceae bacterium]|nr:DoxX family protein [Methylophilaceae bacterium]MDG1821648.1 DoxX family protein [Methylophilaceae bacterium]
MVALIQPLARCMLALIFIIAGLSKMLDLAGTSAYMSVMGVSSALLWPSILLEIIGGILLVLGYKTTLVASVLAIFSIVTAVFFHSDFANQIQMILFLKNISIAGGLLLLATARTTSYSLDRKHEKQNFF